MLVDDHPLILRGYASAVRREETLAVVGEATSGEEALDLLTVVSPQLVVVDLSMGGMGGFELIRRIRDRRPELPILVVSMYGDHAHIEEAVSAGADGYLMKAEAGSGLLVEAIVTVLDEGSFFSEDVRRRYGAPGR